MGKISFSRHMSVILCVHLEIYIFPIFSPLLYTKVPSSLLLMSFLSSLFLNCIQKAMTSVRFSRGVRFKNPRPTLLFSCSGKEGRLNQSVSDQSRFLTCFCLCKCANETDLEHFLCVKRERRGQIFPALQGHNKVLAGCQPVLNNGQSH